MQALIWKLIKAKVSYLRLIALILLIYLINFWVVSISWGNGLPWYQLAIIIAFELLRVSLFMESARVGFYAYIQARTTTILSAISNQSKSVLFSIISLLCFMSIYLVINLEFGSVLKDITSTILLGMIGGFFTAIVNKDKINSSE